MSVRFELLVATRDVSFFSRRGRQTPTAAGTANKGGRGKMKNHANGPTVNTMAMTPTMENFPCTNARGILDGTIAETQ